MGKKKHEYVDLGLPSGTLWATCNVGAREPDGWGDCFAWGETKDKDDWDCTYKYGDNDDDKTKYNSTDGLTTLEAKDDAATANWGKEWRMPTSSEWDELINECTWTWATIDGVDGYEVTGPNGNTIFLPASGYCSDDECDLEDTLGNEGYYWSSSLVEDDPDCAHILRFLEEDIEGETHPRCYGGSVRPVFCKGEEKDNLRENGIYYELNKAKQTAKVRRLPNGDEYSGNVVIPSTISYNGTPFRVTSIGYGAFQKCTGLTVVTIPESVTSIGNYAFNGCTGLTAITIPESVTSIEECAFQDCTGLTAVTIPESVKSIGYGAFYDCTGLTSIVVESGNTVYDSRENCNAIIETATNTLIQGCNTTTIPNSVTSIGDAAFLCCAGCTAITIPDSVTSIGINAFYLVPNIVYSGTATGSRWGARCMNGYVEGHLVYADATKTTLLACSTSATGAITILNSVKSIGDYAFENCTGLTAITLPKTITEIGADVFEGCKKLQTICVPQGMTEAFCTMGLEPWRDKIVENTPSEQSTQKKKDAIDKKQQEHEYVDLGLPSGTLWGTCNVGAEKPENYGNYYAWGETETKDNYSGGSYEYGSDPDNMTKYNATDGLTTLEAKDDAATANWGEEWRMPTEDEWFELIDECTWTWTDLNGVNGYKVKGPNGNTIFLPVSGYCTDDRRRRTGRYGNYWSSSLDTDAGYAEIAFFSASNCYVQGNRRCDGISVRPVFCKEEEKDNLRENTLSCDVYDEPSQDYVIIKTRSEFIEARGSLYEATRHYWHAKLEKAQNYKFALSVVKGVVQEVFEVEKWYESPVRSPRIEFEGEPTTNAEMRALIGKMIPECYRKKGLASPFLYKRK